MKFIHLKRFLLTISLLMFLGFTPEAQELHVQWKKNYRKDKIDLFLEGHCLGPDEDLYAVIGEKTNTQLTSFLGNIRQKDGQLTYFRKFRSQKVNKTIADAPFRPLIYMKSEQKFFVSIPTTSGQGGSSIFTIPIDGKDKAENNRVMGLNIEVHEMVNVSREKILCIGQKNGTPILMMINTMGDEIWVHSFDSKKHRNLSLRQCILMNDSIVLTMSGLVKRDMKMILMKVNQANGDMISTIRLDADITPGTVAIRAVDDERFALSTRRKVKNKKKQKGSIHLFDDELNRLWTTDITQTSGLFSTVKIPMIALQSHIISATYIEKGVRFHVIDLDGDVQTSFEQRMGPPVRGGGQFLKASSHFFYITQSRYPVDDLLDWVQEKNNPIIDTITAFKMDMTPQTQDRSSE